MTQIARALGAPARTSGGANTGSLGTAVTAADIQSGRGLIRIVFTLPRSRWCS
jgi:hypothetical protein